MNSETLFLQSQRVIPGGVNSPVRAFKSVNRHPLFIEKAHGCRIYDVEGNEYIDYVMSWGPLILGHAHAEIIATLQEVCKSGTSFGGPTELELHLAEQICKMVPSIESVRMVNSGTEATMSAVRLARGFTGKDKIVKCDGCYHGHADSFLIQAGSGASTLGVPDSPGVSKSVSGDTISIPYNNIEALEQVVGRFGEDIAAVILEPVAGNMGVIPPVESYLPAVRKITQEKNIILIFDEVITGFRIAPGGAQEYYGVLPDITCLGKIIGGGLPVGAYGGRREIMEMVAPIGPVYQAGTLSGNPLATAVGLKTLEILDTTDVYKKLEKRSAQLENGVRENLKRLNLSFMLTKVGSMNSLFFTEKPVYNYDDVQKCDKSLFSAYFKAMLRNGVYLAPSPFEASFISAAHGEDDIEQTLHAQYNALNEVIS